MGFGKNDSSTIPELNAGHRRHRRRTFVSASFVVVAVIAVFACVCDVTTVISGLIDGCKEWRGRGLWQRRRRFGVVFRRRRRR